VIRTAELHAPEPRARLGEVAWIVAGGLAGLIVAFLAARGLWYVVLALLLLVPAFVVFQRHPLAGVAVWMVLTPLVVATESVAVRQLFWLTHRTLPLGLLVLVIAGAASKASPRKLAKLGLPEALMGLYVAASLVSIVFASGAAGAQVIFLYDRVIVPMCLYLVVRLLEPTSHDLRWLAPVAVFTLMLEVPIGVLSIAAPGALPPIWLVEAQRATGTFGDPDTFGTTMLLCGIILLHAGTTTSRRWLRIAAMFGFTVAMLMMFLTFSRANWSRG